MEDLYVLGDHYSAALLKDHFKSAWDHVISNKKGSRKALLWTLSKAFGWSFYWAGVLKLIGDMAALASPAILKILLEHINEGSTNEAYFSSYWTGICLCFLIFFTQMINTISVNRYFHLVVLVGFRVRTALTGTIYEKSFKLSSKARQEFSTGKIVNLMSTDTSRIETVCSFLHYIWSGIFQILVIVGLLYGLLGWSAFIGLLFSCVSLPVQSRLVSWLSKYRKVLVNSGDCINL